MFDCPSRQSGHLKSRQVKMVSLQMGSGPILPLDEALILTSNINSQG
jgi:hypothetical protein